MQDDDKADRKLGQAVGRGLIIAGLGSWLLSICGLQFQALVWIDGMGMIGHAFRVIMVGCGIYILYQEAQPKE